MGNQTSSEASKNPKITKNDIHNRRKSILEFCNVDKEGNVTLSKTALSLVSDDEDALSYLQSVIKTIPPTDNPSEISHFNYHYVDGKLVNIDTGKPFHWVNQIHYDALGDVIVRHIQKLMMGEPYLLKEVLIPLNQEEGPYNNIFVSEDWDTSEKLMLLIQGSGAVRAGQWARALCINDSLDLGSILPYLTQCKLLNYGVIVFNPNLNDQPVKPPDVPRSSFLVVNPEKIKQPREIPIPGNENSQKHVLYVWDNFVTKAKAKVITAVAHSAGGAGACNLIRSRGEECKERLSGIGFTDSVHSVYKMDDDYVKKFMLKRCRNWVKSSEPLDTVIFQSKYDCLQVSAGHELHEFTSGTSINSVFNFLVDRTTKFLAGEPEEKSSEEKEEKKKKKKKKHQVDEKNSEHEVPKIEHDTKTEDLKIEHDIGEIKEEETKNSEKKPNISETEKLNDKEEEDN